MSFRINHKKDQNDNKSNMDLNIPSSKEEKKTKKGFGITKINGSTSFINRLRTISKRDLSFLIVGIAVLVCAPMAEYFFSKPDTSTALTPGFGERRDSDSNFSYDPGINGMSAGSPDGMEEVIAPLTARDPASLILSGQKQEPVLSAPPPPSDTKRDSIGDIAKKSYVQAVKSSPAPFIPPKMSAALRGLSSVGDSGSRIVADANGNKIMAEAKSAPNKAQKKSMLGPQAIPGYGGVATQSDSVNKGAFEKLRTQADAAAGYFSGANARESLEDAAAAINAKGSADGGFGALNDGDKNTNPSNSSLQGTFSFSVGDPCSGSVENQIACENAKKANEFKNFLKYDLPKSILQSAVDNILVNGVLKPVGDKVAKATKSMVDPSGPPPPTRYCWKNKSKKVAVETAEDKDGHIQLIPPVSLSDCPCGFLTTEPDPDCSGPTTSTATPNGTDPVVEPSTGPTGGNGGGAGGNGGGSGGGTAGGDSGGVNPAKSDIESYDTYLKEAIAAAKTGELATDVPTLKQQSDKASKNIESALGVAQNITKANVSKVDANGFKKAMDYKMAISEVNSKVKTLKDDYNSFNQELNKFDETLTKAINDYKSGKIKPKLQKGVSAETLGGQDIISKLQEAKTKLSKIKQDAAGVKDEYLTKFEKRLNSHAMASNWYIAQIQNIKKMNNEIYSFTVPEANEVQSISSQLASIPPTTADPNDINGLKQLFSSLTGLTPKNISNNTTPASPLPAASDVQFANAKKASVFRMAPQGSGGKITKLISWRGADEKAAWGGEITDKSKLEEDKKNFDSVKPSLTLTKGEYSSSFAELAVKESFVVSMSRLDLVNKDIEASKKLVSNILEGVDGFNLLLGRDKTDLAKLQEELKPLLDQLKPTPKPTPAPKPTTPKPTKPTNNQTTTVIINNIISNTNNNNNSNTNNNTNNSNSGIQIKKK
ncbi:MAG: hypothetical protein GX445_03735 [Elusimicrobia bacterium]|nr:hypothetical protein [Elusimicrobiota bacterium]